MTRVHQPASAPLAARNSASRSPASFAARGRPCRPAAGRCGVNGRYSPSHDAHMVKPSTGAGSACDQAAAAAGYRSCRPARAGRATAGQPGAEPTRPSQARSSTCMASRMAPSIRRSRSAGVMSPRSARSRKIAQACSRAASTVSTVITVPTSTPDVPPVVLGRSRGFGPHHGPQAAASTRTIQGAAWCTRRSTAPAGRAAQPGAESWSSGMPPRPRRRDQAGRGAGGPGRRGGCGDPRGPRPPWRMR